MEPQERIVPLPSGLLNTNTIKRSQERTLRDPRSAAEDLRSRRVGYNPGFLMTMSPRHSGLQLELIPPQVAILFETGPIKKQNLSVDAADQSKPDIDGELLAGEGMANVMIQYGSMGFGELGMFRGVEDDNEIIRGMYEVHAPLSELSAEGIIPKCPYEDFIADIDPFTGKREVCLACRVAALVALDADARYLPLATDLRRLVGLGHKVMLGNWRAVLGEIRGGAPSSTAQPPTKGHLDEDTLYFMRQLHEFRPEDIEMLRVTKGATVQADAIAKAIESQTATIMKAVSQDRGESAEVIALREQIARQQAQFDALTAQVAALAKPPAEAAVKPEPKSKAKPPETEKAK